MWFIVLLFGCYKSYCCECSWTRFCVGNPFIRSHIHWERTKPRSSDFKLSNSIQKVVSVGILISRQFSAVFAKNKDVNFTLYVRVIRYLIYTDMSLFFLGNIWQSHKSYPGSASKNCGTKEILGEGI